MRSAAPWVIAGVAAVVFAVLFYLYYSVLPDYKNSHTPGDLTATEQRAVTAAATETTNLLSYRRANFDADFQRAVDGATGGLKTDIQGKRAATLAAMTKGKFDLTARVTNQALEGPTDKGGTGYIVLLTVNGYQSTQPQVPNQQSLRVTVVDVKGQWLATDVQNVSVS
ncbi:MAG TPA: hypothetical protein VGN18_03355 [Jatrophihabitans sp.]|jgi:hypothetical protein|uniref:hypothetical protein n=1 Tax=Jatrophihabitans sp. TaxID=1932789 RepID=UPI002E06EFEB|nr:hypothetical protein [Jatrophihabitans sp.]